MIAILTCESEVSSDLVVEWLNYYNYPFVRINSYDLLRDDFFLSITDKKIILHIRGQEIMLDYINAIWYRKFGYFTTSSFYEDAVKSIKYKNLDHLTKEFSKVLGSILGVLKDKKWLTNPSLINLNKAEVLIYAKECGFSIPNSYIINNKTHLKELVERNEIITKSVYDSAVAQIQNYSYMMYTNVVNKGALSDLPDSFFPSLVQDKIEKKYELRVFYIDGKCYSMAIFSQNDSLTNIDFRKYNWNKPNRFVPYELPTKIKRNIQKLMKKIGLNCASIDIIYGSDDVYYFLEINPTGQFGMVDFPCNYGLHKKVAEVLIKMDNF